MAHQVPNQPYPPWQPPGNAEVAGPAIAAGATVLGAIFIWCGLNAMFGPTPLVGPVLPTFDYVVLSEPRPPRHAMLWNIETDPDTSPVPTFGDIVSDYETKQLLKTSLRSYQLYNLDTSPNSSSAPAFGDIVYDFERREREDVECRQKLDKHRMCTLRLRADSNQPLHDTASSWDFDQLFLIGISIVVMAACSMLLTWLDYYRDGISRISSDIGKAVSFQLFMAIVMVSDSVIVAFHHAMKRINSFGDVNEDQDNSHNVSNATTPDLLDSDSDIDSDTNTIIPDRDQHINEDHVSPKTPSHSDTAVSPPTPPTSPTPPAPPTPTMDEMWRAIQVIQQGMADPSTHNQLNSVLVAIIRNLAGANIISRLQALEDARFGQRLDTVDTKLHTLDNRMSNIEWSGSVDVVRRVQVLEDLRAQDSRDSFELSSWSAPSPSEKSDSTSQSTV